MLVVMRCVVGVIRYKISEIKEKYVCPALLNWEFAIPA